VKSSVFSIITRLTTVPGLHHARESNLTLYLCQDGRGASIQSYKMTIAHSHPSKGNTKQYPLGLFAFSEVFHAFSL
jgi:hypothetical protein